MKSKVFLLMTCCWITPARFALALDAEGCTVEAICPPAHVLRRLKQVSRTYTYNGFLSSIRSALLQSRPAFIIPCDDFGTSCLCTLYQQELQTSDAHGLAALIRHSLGSPENCSILIDRQRFIEASKQLGIRVPATVAIPSPLPNLSWFRSQQYPAYVKADGTSGGTGVRLASTPARAQHAAIALQRPPGFLRTLKRYFVDQDRRLLQPFLRRQRSSISLQTPIKGHEANASLACWQGELIDCTCFEVVERTEAHGPSTVLRVIQHPEMKAAATALVRQLRLSGLYGLDFILSANGDAWLLEMNARATQTCHLSFGPGNSPLPSIAARILGRTDTKPDKTLQGQDTIALFPSEWLRDLSSPWIQSAYNDVPWDSPKLIQAALQPNLLDRLRPERIRRLRAIQALLNKQLPS